MRNILSKVFYLYRKLPGYISLPLVTVFATIIDYWVYRIRSSSNQKVPSYEFNNEKILHDLISDGYSVVENYYPESECGKIRNEIDRLIGDYPDSIHLLSKADTRIFGADKLSELINSFPSSDFLSSIANQYTQTLQDSAFTLAARMDAKPGNLGSGEGWHRDAFFCQFKAILYVSDVSIDNGPFQLVSGSHKLWQIIKDIFKCKLHYMQDRIDTTQVDCLTNSNNRLLSFPASAGTLLLVDTSIIHRGMPIKEGTRYALTNYYFPTDTITPELYEKFSINIDNN